jgi:hypothetical protein
MSAKCWVCPEKFLAIRKNFCTSGKTFLCPEKNLRSPPPPPPPPQQFWAKNINDGNVVGKYLILHSTPPPLIYPLRYGPDSIAISLSKIHC